MNCVHCTNNIPRVQLADGTWGHEFNEGSKAWMEPCSTPRDESGDGCPSQMATAKDKMFWMLQETTAKMSIDEIYQLRARCEEHFNKLTSPTEWDAYQRNVATVKRNRQ